MMTDREQYRPDPASGAQFRRFWSAQVDALERHLDCRDPDRIESAPTKKKTREKQRGPNRKREKGETK